ncbi:hypothetical protein BH23DEI1_BH23DEI1_09730 [soil metagenome]
MDHEGERQDGVSAPDASGDALFEQLGAALLWRVGRTADDAPVTVRVGFATSAPKFAELTRLRSASDAEIEEAVRAGVVEVEWVGPRAR